MKITIPLTVALVSSVDALQLKKTHETTCDGLLGGPTMAAILNKDKAADRASLYAPMCSAVGGQYATVCTPEALAAINDNPHGLEVNWSTRDSAGEKFAATEKERTYGRLAKVYRNHCDGDKEKGQQSTPPAVGGEACKKLLSDATVVNVLGEASSSKRASMYPAMCEKVGATFAKDCDDMSKQLLNNMPHGQTINWEKKDTDAEGFTAPAGSYGRLIELYNKRCDGTKAKDAGGKSCDSC